MKIRIFGYYFAHGTRAPCSIPCETSILDPERRHMQGTVHMEWRLNVHWLISQQHDTSHTSQLPNKLFADIGMIMEQ